MALNSWETLSSMTWIPMKTDNVNPFTANQLKSHNMKKQARRPPDHKCSDPDPNLARTENRMLLSVKIQDAMTAKGIGKKQLAEMMGQSPSVITKWLSGGHNFTVDTLTVHGAARRV
ncbi:MAG: helix-turn-helix transcriptional regulator [Lewinellaceae bacterium]|nr:helix-turn-helix transcriptional regulator [Lewinellaceae bacterium]